MNGGTDSQNSIDLNAVAREFRPYFLGGLRLSQQPSTQAHLAVGG
jgi:hypothetical protein